MKNLKTPHAILYGFGLVALAIFSLPYDFNSIKPAIASNTVHKIAICDKNGFVCVDIKNNSLQIQNNL